MPILRLTRTRGQFWAQTFIALLSDFSGVSEFTSCNILGGTVWSAFPKIMMVTRYHVIMLPCYHVIEVFRPEYNVWWLSQNHKWQSDITIFSKRVDPWISVSAWRLLFQLIMNKSKRHIRRREKLMTDDAYGWILIPNETPAQDLKDLTCDQTLEFY